jgi:hypothetical protein
MYVGLVVGLGDLVYLDCRDQIWKVLQVRCVLLVIVTETESVQSVQVISQPSAFFKRRHTDLMYLIIFLLTS